MSSNKAAKEALIRRYGNTCFIERLHLRDTSKMRYTGCGQLKRMKQLTYHHILEKSKGGRATIENGALLSCENHEWFHKQSKEAQRQMNNMFQELKRKIDHEECRIEYVDTIECPFEVRYMGIYLDENGRLNAEALKEEKIDLKEIKQKQKRKERRELQKIKKEYEDR